MGSQIVGLSDFHFGDLKEKHFYLFLKCILFKNS